MTLGVRGKFFLVSVLVTAAVVLVVGFFLEAGLREWLMNRLKSELFGEARIARELLREETGKGKLADWDRLADRIGKASAARVTIIDARGAVLGDSEVDGGLIHRVENHADRPEVAAAVAGGGGESVRFSETLETGMLYVALPVTSLREREPWVVRFAMPLGEVDDMMRRLRLVLAAAAALGLVGIALMSGLTAHFLTRNLRVLLQRIKAPDPAAAPNVSTADFPRDEIGGLADSFNQMTALLEKAVGDLALERNQMEAVLQAMEEGVVAVDEGRRVTLVNQSALTLLDRSLPPIPIGRPLTELLPMIVDWNWLEEVRAGESIYEEFTLPGEPAKRILVEGGGRRDGKGSVLVMRDVTERNKLETMRRDFVASVSHELRTPVSVVLANAETLLDGALEDPHYGRKLLSAVERSAQRLSRLIDDLLDLSRLEAGRYHMATVPTAPAEAVARVGEMIEEAARTKEIEVTADLEEAAPVLADPMALEQVLLNLLENAVKYTPSGGRILIGARRVEGRRLRIEVADNGPGVPPEERPRLFEPFYRSDKGRSREMGGTGLGLSIVRNLLDNMGGQVGIEGVEPHGALFWVELPLVD